MGVSGTDVQSRVDRYFETVKLSYSAGIVVLVVGGRFRIIYSGRLLNLIFLKP